MNHTNFRELTVWEREVLEHLLESPFPGRDEIRRQLHAAVVRQIDEYADNYGSLEFRVPTGERALVEQRVPVEAIAKDADGVPIEFLLHVVNGFVDELEIVKADGSPIERRPSAADLVVEVGPRVIPEEET